MASTATNIIAAATAKLASRADTQSAQPIPYDEEDLPNLSSTHMLPSSDLQAHAAPHRHANLTRTPKTKVTPASPKAFLGASSRRRLLSQAHASPSRHGFPHVSPILQMTNSHVTTSRGFLPPLPTCSTSQGNQQDFPKPPSPASLVMLSWNCCGIGNPATVQRLIDVNKKHSPNIIFLQETKNQDENILKETESLQLESHFLVSPQGHGAGGLALLWRSDIDIQVMSSNRNLIDTTITYKNTNFQSIFVYGAPEIHLRQEVWNYLTTISAASDSPWFLT